MPFDIPGSAWSAAVVAAAVAAATTDPLSEPKSGLPPSIFKVATEQSSVQPDPPPAPPPAKGLPPSIFKVEVIAEQSSSVQQSANTIHPLSQQQQQQQHHQPVTDIPPIPSSAWSAAVAAATATAINPLSLQARGLPPSILNVAAEQSSVVQTSVIHTNTSDIPEPRFGKRPHDNENDNNNNNNNNNHNRTNRNSSNRKNKRQRRRGKQEQDPVILPPSGCSVCKIVKENEPPKYKCPKCRASYCNVACCRKHKLVCPGKVGEEGSSAPDSTGTTKEAAKTAASTLTQTQTPSTLESDTDDYSDNDGDADDDSSLEDGWQITDDMKVALRNSTWLRTELQDGGLRSMMKKVVRYEKNYKSHHRRKGKWRQSSGNFNNKKNHKRNDHLIHPHEVLGEKRSDNKNFDVFVDKLLVLADVLERQDGPVDLESSGEQQPASFAASATTSGGGILSSSNRNEEELEEWLRLPFDQPGMAPPALALRPRQKTIPKFEPVVLSSSEDEDEGDSEGDK